MVVYMPTSFSVLPTDCNVYLVITLNNSSTSSISLLSSTKKNKRLTLTLIHWLLKVWPIWKWKQHDTVRPHLSNSKQLKSLLSDTKLLGPDFSPLIWKPHCLNFDTEIQ